MLRWLALALVASTAHAAPRRDRIREPDRLTAGQADNFLGALSPDGQKLYFVSAVNATLQIFAQDLRGGPPSALFDDSADATLPRPSPDGQSLAYLSYRGDATGDVCVRDLKSMKRRCLTDADTAEQDLLWAGPGALLAVTRPGLHEDLELDRIAANVGGRQTVLKRGLASPALSPDGKWLAYVPTERESDQVGAAFASHATKSLVLQRFDQLGGKPLEVVLDLAGASAFPAFSADGRWLYFAQYLDDTNLDGVIDGGDQSTLFRVAFDGGAAIPVTDRERLHPQQLTSMAWNCQYPAPGPIASDRLITTCSIAGSLDVYSLPLDGAIPPEWTADKLHDELRVATDRGERLLITSRLLALGAPDERLLLEDELRTDLDRLAFDSAAWVLQRLRTLGHVSPEVLAVFDELVAHRRTERALDRGQLSAPFIADTRLRLERLDAMPGTDEAGAFRDLVRVELLDVLGEKQAAVKLLRTIDLQRATSPLLLQLLASRATDLYRQLDDRDALLALYLALTTHDTLDEVARLEYADRYIATLLRGVPRASHLAIITDALKHVPPDSEVAMRLELERGLFDLDTPELDDAGVEKIRAATLDLYKRSNSLERRRLIVHVTVARAGSGATDVLLEDLAKAWVDDLPHHSAERRYANQIYRHVLIERAYVDMREGRLDAAAEHFYTITQRVDGLESWSNWLTIMSKKDPAKARATLESRFVGKPNDPVLRYGLAYLAVEALPDDPQQKLRRIDEALGHVQIAAEGLSRSVELNYLWGHCLYERYLATGKKELAEEADAKLLLALDLARENPRYRASSLETLGRTQAGVGNHRLAVGHYEARDELPFASPLAELGHLLAAAHSNQMLDEEHAATNLMERALALVKNKKELARFEALVLDRAALHDLAGGNAERAATRFDLVLKTIAEAEVTTRESARDHFTALFGRGASRLASHKPADAARDLAEAATMLDRDPKLAFAPSPRPTDLPPDRDAPRTYHLLLAGMRAEAARELGDLDEAVRAQTKRRDLLLARYKDFTSQEDLLALGESEARLGEYAAARGDLATATLRYEAALGWAEKFSDESGTQIHPLRLSVISDLVVLRMREPLVSRDHVKLDTKVRALLDLVAKQRKPEWVAAAAELERDLTSLQMQQRLPQTKL